MEGPEEVALARGQIPWGGGQGQSRDLEDPCLPLHPALLVSQMLVTGGEMALLLTFPLVLAVSPKRKYYTAGGKFFSIPREGLSNIRGTWKGGDQESS